MSRSSEIRTPASYIDPGSLSVIAQNVRSHEILVKSFTFWALRNSQQLFTVTDNDAEVPMYALSISEFLSSSWQISLAGSVFVKFSMFCVFLFLFRGVVSVF